MDRRSFISAALAAGVVLAVRPAVAGATARTADPRVEQTLARMTRAQKIALIRCDFAAVAGLGVPALSMADSAAGIRGASGVTAFPVPLAQAAAFHPDLATRIGTALAAEGRGKGFNNLLSPSVDLVRSWHAGRQSEALGEDPHLASVVGRALTTAMRQGKVLPTVKHFAAYTQETDRFVVNAQVAERALHEVYYAPFRAIVSAAPAVSVMMAYPRVNGVYASQNPVLFDDLKRRIGLTGHTVPDFWAGDDQVAAANAGMDLAGLGPGAVRVSADQIAAGVPTARIDDAARRILTSIYDSGVADTPLPPPADDVSTPAHRALAHEAAVHATVLLSNRSAALPLTGVRSVAVIGPAGTTAFTGVAGSAYVDPGAWTTPLQAIKDRAGTAVRVTQSTGTLGDVPLPVVPSSVLRTPAGAPGLAGTFHAGATPSGTPLGTATTATLEFAAPPVAGLPPVWSGRWTGTLTPTTTGLHRFSLLASGTATLTVNGTRVISGTRHSRRFFVGGFDYPLQGTISLTAGRAVSITVDYTNATGTPGEAYLALGWQPVSLIPDAVAAARAADAAVVVVNRIAGEDMDHDTLALPGDQDQLIAAVAAANPRTVVVLNTDGPAAMPWLGSVGSVVQSWYGGRGMGTALAAVLFGDTDPAGRLPVTFPAAETQGPAATPATYPGTGQVVQFREGVHVGHRYYDRNNQTPLFPFGHGLSYTTFTIGNLEATYNPATATLTATATVTNTGSREGWHTVQFYAALPAAADAETRRLIGFAKTSLKAKSQTRVSVTADARALSVWDSAAGNWKLVAGNYTISAGSSSRDLPVRRVLPLG